jgi:uncharacterized protein YbaA (DUF1428 family)
VLGVECWGDDVPEGKLTSFPMAVKLEPGETVVFSWIVWPSREARDAGNAKVMADPPDAAPRRDALRRKAHDGARVCARVGGALAAPAPPALPLAKKEKGLGANCRHGSR